MVRHAPSRNGSAMHRPGPDRGQGNCFQKYKVKFWTAAPLQCPTYTPGVAWQQRWLLTGSRCCCAAPVSKTWGRRRHLLHFASCVKTGCLMGDVVPAQMVRKTNRTLSIVSQADNGLQNGKDSLDCRTVINSHPKCIF